MTEWHVYKVCVPASFHSGALRLLGFELQNANNFHTIPATQRLAFISFEGTSNSRRYASNS